MTPPVFQYAYFVEDLERAATAWARTVGAGPFFVAAHHRAQRVAYRGTDVEADVSYAFGYSGAAQIQLIQQHDDLPMTEFHVRTPRIDATFERWHRAHVEWDGTELLRGHVSGT